MLNLWDEVAILISTRRFLDEGLIAEAKAVAGASITGSLLETEVVFTRNIYLDAKLSLLTGNRHSVINHTVIFT